MAVTVQVSLIKGDGIGVDVTNSAQAVMDHEMKKAQKCSLSYSEIKAGAGYYKDTGKDIEPNGEENAGKADAIFLGAIGLPSVRYENGTEISPHLRLRDKYQLYAGVRPVRAYPNGPQKLSDPNAAKIDFIIIRESTEGLFYSAAVHQRSQVIGDEEVRDTLRITRKTTEKLHHFAYKLAEKRKQKGYRGKLACVDKANVFTSMAFFRKIFDEIGVHYPAVEKAYNYVDAQALDFVRKPWESDVLVMENMFGDILSDLAGGLVGGMGMAACGEIGDKIGLFQPAHGSAPDIMGQDKANPLAAILSGAMMLDYLSDKTGEEEFARAANRIETAVYKGFEQKRIRPQEFGGDMGTLAITKELIQILDEI